MAHSAALGTIPCNFEGGGESGLCQLIMGSL